MEDELSTAEVPKWSRLFSEIDTVFFFNLFGCLLDLSIKMEGLKLGEIEQAYYAELFQTCDVEGTGKITSLKASELFLASSLHQDALKQVS